MASKTVWIKNNTTASVRVKATRITNKKTGETEEVVVDLLREKVDRATGQVTERGYTAVSSEDYDALIEGSKIFKAYVDKKDFVVYDEAPEDAYSDAQRIAMLETKISELQATSANAVATAEALATAKEEIAALGEELDAAKAELQEAVAAKEGIANEFEAYKKQFPTQE